MTRANFTKTVRASAALSLVVFVGKLLTSPPGLAAAPGSGGDDASRIQQGFAIAPVPLNLKGKNVALVGLGSYLVNALGDCNGCHTSGGPPNFNYLGGHNPYFLLQGPTMTDPANYLAGGADFGTALPFNVPPGSAYGNYLGPDIVTRNLTPDKNGLPEGGMTLAEFKEILRTGVDMDKIHPTCISPTGGPGGTPTPANCIPPPVNGALLQIMPWPVFHNLSDGDIDAIYEYLSAIPCIDNTTSTPPAGAPNELRNDCGNGAPPKHGGSTESNHQEPGSHGAAGRSPMHRGN
jgi:hypothetical protein